MESKIDSVLSAESKADALQVEARDEGERKLHRTRAEIDGKRSKLDEELTQCHEKAVSEARAAAEDEVKELRRKEGEEAEATKTKGKGRLEKASEVILDALLEQAAAVEEAEEA